MWIYRQTFSFDILHCCNAKTHKAKRGMGPICSRFSMCSFSSWKTSVYGFEIICQNEARLRDQRTETFQWCQFLNPRYLREYPFYSWETNGYGISFFFLRNEWLWVWHYMLNRSNIMWYQRRPELSHNQNFPNPMLAIILKICWNKGIWAKINILTSNVSPWLCSVDCFVAFERVRQCLIQIICS